MGGSQFLFFSSFFDDYYCEVVNWLCSSFSKRPLCQFFLDITELLQMRRLFFQFVIFFCVVAVSLFGVSNSQPISDKQHYKLFEIDHEGNIKIPIESIEKIRKIESPISFVLSLGLARSGKTTLVSLISGESPSFEDVNEKESDGVRWVQTNGDGSIFANSPKNNDYILLDTESLVIGRGINSSIKLAILALILSDHVLVNSINEIDILLIDFTRLLISKAVMFSSLFVRKLNESSIPNKKSLKKNLIFLVENLHKTNISWILHRNLDLKDEQEPAKFSRKYKDLLKSKLEKYIWPETSQSKIFKNLDSFIERFNFYKIPYFGTEKKYNGYRYHNKIDDLDLDQDHQFGKGNNRSIFLDIFKPSSGEEHRLTGAEIADLLELFSEHSYIFNSFKSLNFGITKGDLKTSNLVENTLLIFGTRLENQLLNENIYPLLEIEADAIYNKTLKDIESYWSSISEFDYFDFSSLLKSVQPHFEKQYKSILSKNCERIRSHCSDVIDIHISHATHQIDQFHEKIPIPQSMLIEFTNNLVASTLNDIELALNKSFGSFESDISSYRNSPCCNIDGSLTQEKIESALSKLKKRNQEEIEKILLDDFEQALNVIRSLEEVDDSYYKVSKEDFEKKLEKMKNSSKLVFNTHITIINETDLHSKYWKRLNSELDEFIERKMVDWKKVCRKYSYNFAKSIAIRKNISIRNKLTLPIVDSVILESFEDLKDNVIKEMNGIYCSNEESWKDALMELMNVIEDDKEQLMKENLIALKNLLHRPLKYALKNAIEITKQHYNWMNFVREATILAQNSLEDSDNWGSINLDSKTKDRVVELWIEMDLSGIRKGFVRNQIFMIVRYLLYSLIFTIITFITLFKNNSKLVLGVVFLSFIASVLLFSSIELGVAGETISHHLSDLFVYFGISRFTLYYIKHNIALIFAILVGLTCAIVYISLNFKSGNPDSNSVLKPNSFQEKPGPEISPRQKVTNSNSPAASPSLREKLKNQNKSSNAVRTFIF
ncbi:putative transmembrane domain-containing [Cryptosporidium hominis]